LKALLERHIQRINCKIQVLEEGSSRLSNWRLSVFVGILLFLFIGSDLNGFLFTFLLIAFIGLFLYLVTQHKQVADTLKKFEFLKQIKEEHIARINLEWDAIKTPEFQADIKYHPFADDLNCVGKQSLHHLIDTSIYEGSSKLLSDWLLTQEPVAQQILNRQQLIQNLKPFQIFRDKLRVTALFTKTKATRGDWSMDQLLEWLKLPKKTGFKLPLAVLTGLAISNLSLGILALIGVISSIPFVLSLLSYVIIYKLNSEKISGLYDATFEVDKLLGRFGAILLQVEQFNFKKESLLTEFVEVFHQQKVKPSVYLKKVKKLAGSASLQTNQVLWPLVNLMMPWDLYYAMRFEDLKHDLEPKLAVWLDKFYQLEALNSIANFAALNPDYPFPSFEENEETPFSAKGLGHPLIADSNKVTNDFKVETGKELFLLTGSNMAGKSTFLRTVGINLILAYAGAPVNAKELTTSYFRVFTSINIVDSLGDGLSHFYAEVKRLKRLLDELREPNELPLFYFVDEIYKGTNNKERYIGSAAFLKEVAGKNGMGLVSTHDLELAGMEKEIPQLSNWHFSELIVDGKMSFDYKLKPGACPSTNALQIMKIEGLPI